ncbi:MAG: hypothetical protein ACR2OD_08010, partial [Gaiellaceae bacterium]
LYLVDSFGAFYSEQITAYIQLYQKNAPSKPLGFHAHNNQQLAFSNTQQAIIDGVDLLDATIALWHALEAGADEQIYALYFPICAMVALEMQAGLDGFIAIEKHILVRRGLFKSARRREPKSFELDDEMAREVDRLLALMGVTTLP